MMQAAAKELEAQLQRASNDLDSEKMQLAAERAQLDKRHMQVRLSIGSSTCADLPLRLIRLFSFLQAGCYRYVDKKNIGSWSDMG